MSTLPLIPLDSLAFGIHPGAVLRRYLNLLHKTQSTAADLMGMSRQNVGELINERRNVTPAAAYQLAGLCGTEAEYWLTLQHRHDLHKHAERRARRGEG